MVTWQVCGRASANGQKNFFAPPKVPLKIPSPPPFSSLKKWFAPPSLQIEYNYFTDYKCTLPNMNVFPLSTTVSILLPRKLASCLLIQEVQQVRPLRDIQRRNFFTLQKISLPPPVVVTKNSSPPPECKVKKWFAPPP